jgi:gliding motility-associated-like protein
MLKYLAIALLFFFATQAFGQSFYAVTNSGQLKRVTIKGSTISDQNISSCDPLASGGSIAVYKHTLYSVNGFFQSKSTISGNSLINCAPISNIPFSNALTVGSDGILYSMNGSVICKTDPATNITTSIGNTGFFSAGDLVFYKNNLYLASSLGIVKINLSNPQLSTLVIPGLYGVWALVSVAYSSTQNKVYAMDINQAGGTDIRELDLDNNSVAPKIATLPYQVYDAASDTEDGSFAPVEISSIKQYGDCPYVGKGTIEIICTNALIDYQYTLNGVTNTTGIFTGLSPGTYNVSVSSPSETKSTVLTVAQFTPQKPVLNISKVNPVCVAPGQITVAAVGDGADYRIKYGGNVYNFDHVFNNLTAGNYHFSIINANGCEVDAADVSLTQDVCKVTVTATDITEECANPGKGNVKITTAAHNETYTYNINAVVNTAGVFNNLDPGNYQVHIASSNGDSKDQPIIIPDYNLTKPTVTVVKTDPVCETPGIVSFTVLGNSSQYRVQLGANIYPFNYVFTGLTAGNYHFNILKQDNCLLMVKDVTLIRSKCAINLNNTDVTEECNLPGKGSIKINVQPHPDSYSYKIIGGVSNNTGVFNAVSPGTYQVQIVSSEDQKVVDVTVPDYNLSKPQIGYILTKPVCEVPGTIKLTLQNGNSSLYKAKLGNSVFEFDHLFTGLVAGDYHFDVIKQDGCILTSVDVTVTRNKCEIFLDGADVQQECNLIYKGVVQIKSQPHTYSYTYKLSNGTTNTTGVFNDLASGSYTVTVTSSEDEKQITVNVPDYKLTNPVATFTAKDAICEIKGHIKFSLSINSNGTLYKIKFNSVTYPFNHDFELGEGTYDFTVLKPDGCLLDNYTVNLKKEGCEDLFFPNTFTPNGDGINDIFAPNPKARADDFKFKLYNRYGALIFTSGSSHIGWDGAYNGKPAPVGVYYWIATYINNEGRSLQKSGYVALVR